jgi:spoIIIJ-associated protein
MEWVETTGKTLEEARDAALDMLGVDESDAEFVTITEPRPGLFGRLRGEARVRARVLPATPPPKRNRSRRPAPRRDSSPDVRNPRAEKPESKEDSPGPDQESPDAGNGRSRSAQRRRTRSAKGAVESTAANGAGAVSGGARRPRKKVTKSSQAEEETVAETLSLEEQADLAKRFIEGLVAELGLSATVTAKPVAEDEVVQVAVDGDELGILVGQGGATLSALQELARTVVQRKAGGHIERIFVDVAGYRARRAEALGRFTRKVVEDVIASGSDKALEPMSPADRKVVHDSVNEIGGAVTRSEGEEPRRYVVISPATDSAPSSVEVPTSSEGDDTPSDGEG